MSVRVPATSRLRFSQLYVIDDVEFWDLPEIPEIPVSDGDKYHTVVGNDRIDLISTKYYNDPILWWVIAVANNLDLIPSEVYEGQVLRIPDRATLDSQVFSKALVV